jgi:hypothetical protein
MNLRANQLVCFVYNENAKTMTIYMVNSHLLDIRSKLMTIDKMRLPWISFFKNTDLFTVNRRIYNYYRNVMLT